MRRFNVWLLVIGVYAGFVAASESQRTSDKDIQAQAEIEAALAASRSADRYVLPLRLPVYRVSDCDGQILQGSCYGTLPSEPVGFCYGRIVGGVCVGQVKAH